MNSHFKRGALLLDQRRYEEAIGEFQLHLGQVADDPTTHAMIALALAGLERLPEATEHAQRAIHLGPDDPFGHFALARVLLDRNRYPEAQTAIEEAIRLDPHDADYFSLLSSLQLLQSRWREALAAAEQGLAIDPEHNACINLRAQALVKLGDRAAAAQTLGEALARRPDDALSHANQGWTLLHQGDPYKALEHFREALRLDPELEFARAGIVEALKARNFVYRWLLAYFLWMARLPPQVQWGLVIGALVGNRVIRSIADKNPPLEPYLEPILYAYFGFVVLNWLASPFFNLLLRLDRFGRHALSRDEIQGANVLLACLFVTLGHLFWAIAGGNGEVWYFVLMFALLSLPASAIYRCSEGWPRNVMLAITLVLLAGILVIYAPLLFVPKESLHPLLELLLLPIILALPWAMLASQFAANYLASGIPKR
ncbi:MAG: tetratricopeptide repeat protein [Pirellulaceae bacterium]|nr:tetratricopeptide repeat protein [Pirellulaceae bacterium]